MRVMSGAQKLQLAKIVVIGVVAAFVVWMTKDVEGVGSVVALISTALAGVLSAPKDAA